jgi:hypothetical protein
MLSPAVGLSTNEWINCVVLVFNGSGWLITNEPPALFTWPAEQRLFTKV